MDYDWQLGDRSRDVAGVPSSDYQILLQENLRLRDKINLLEEERQIFHKSYEHALEQIIIMRNSCQCHPKPDNVLKKSSSVGNIECSTSGKNRDKDKPSVELIPVHEFFEILDVEPSKSLQIKQKQRLSELLRRSEHRQQLIRDASRRREAELERIKRSVAYALDNSQEEVNYFEFDYRYRKLCEIAAFPMSEIRRATFKRLIKFGVFNAERDAILAQRERIVGTVISHCSSERNRRNVLNLGAFGSPCDIAKYRRQVY